MQTDHQNRIEEFMTMAGQEVPESPTQPSESTRELRARLILEEALEAAEALGVDVQCCGKNIGFDDLNISANKNIEANLSEFAKEAVDISVVTIGSLSALGIKDKPLLEAVDENNILKIAKATKREDGKLIKDPNHPKVDVKSLLYQQGMAV